MTKVLSVLLLVICSSTTFAQLEKSSLLIGGELAYDNSKLEQGSAETKNNGGRFAISIGRVINATQVFGVSVGFGSNKQTVSNFGNTTGVNKTNTTQAGLFFRQYKKIGNTVYFFGEAAASAAFSKTTQTFFSPERTSEVKQTAVSLGLTPGVAWRVLPKLFLEVSVPSIAGVRYSTTKEKPAPFNPAPEATQTSFSFQSALSNSNLVNALSFGFRLII